ncbi:MAG: HPr family phosphocarrier protein, partial [Planctomycetes bacterium]|nr:HPr family phosphocarrier protein [Planctomycetota bacterium]
LPMTEPSLETIIPETGFSDLIRGVAGGFANFSSSLLVSSEECWPKRFYFRLHLEADELEVQLDDYGARYNSVFCLLTELTASIRGFAAAGLSLTHLSKRVGDYGIGRSLDSGAELQLREGLEQARAFVQRSICTFIEAWFAECESREFAIERGTASPPTLPPAHRFRLPRDLGHEELSDESQRIAEVASKYLQAVEMLEASGLHEELDAKSRWKLLQSGCTEQIARVFEATVHNLQSAYDTFIGNTLVEREDARLKQLRGHISTVLHLLGAVTHLTHFVERHESGQKVDVVDIPLSKLVDRDEVQDLILNKLMAGALAVIRAGVPLAEELLPRYTDMATLTVELPEHLSLHARPASLIVAIATFHGTPVVMEIGESTASASSILEVMVLVGSNADSRVFRFLGDSKPLDDIRCLFESGLGEEGLEKLPPQLSYLAR